MKPLKVNTTWEADEQARIEFFANLSYSERLQYYFKLRDLIKFDRTEYPKGKILKISHPNYAS